MTWGVAALGEGGTAVDRLGAVGGWRPGVPPSAGAPLNLLQSHFASMRYLWDAGSDDSG